MTVKELIKELECFDEDMNVVFDFNDDVEVESWTENKWGGRNVHIDAYLKPTFISCVLGDCNIELGILEEK